MIIPNADLDQGMDRVEIFRDKLDTTIMSTRPVNTPKSYFGISARNGRLLSGSRIFAEAKQALSKAKKEGTQIIAFRVDPEKYRAYLANQQRGTTN